MKTERRSQHRPAIVWLLIIVHVFLALNGLVGGALFLAAPDGRLMQMPVSLLSGSPFSDFRIPGLLLFCFLGVYPLAVAYSLWKKPLWRWPEVFNPFKRTHWSWAASLAAGVIAMIWIAVQVQWIVPSFLQTVIFGWGAVIVALTLLPAVRQYCSKGTR